MLFVGLVTAQPAFARSCNFGRIQDLSTLELQSQRPTCPLPDVRWRKVAWIWPFRLRGSVDKPQQGRKTRTQFRLFFSPFPLHRHQRLRTQRGHRRKGIRQRCAATAALGMAYSDWPRQKMDSLLIHGRPFEVPGKEARPGKEPPQLCGPHLKPSSEPLPPLTVSASPFCLDLGKPVGAVSDANRLLIGSRHGPSQRPPSSSGCTLPVLVLHLTLLSSIFPSASDFICNHGGYHLSRAWYSRRTSSCSPKGKLLTSPNPLDPNRPAKNNDNRPCGSDYRFGPSYLEVVVSSLLAQLSLSSAIPRFTKSIR
jgi:hypothetical protein